MTFKPNPNFEAELSRGPEFNQALAESADDAISFVQRAAPHHTGDYAKSIEILNEGDAVILTSDDPFAHLIEWGSANNPPYAPLRRGVRAAGLKFREAGK